MAEGLETPRGASGATGVAGVGAVLVGVGLVLVYLWGKGGLPRSDRITHAHLTLGPDGEPDLQEKPLRIPITNPHASYVIHWRITNTADDVRYVLLENFRRNGKGVSPFRRNAANRVKPVRGNATETLVSAIDDDAIQDLLDSSDREHKYEYDIWVDRTRRQDPEIIIFKG